MMQSIGRSAQTSCSDKPARGVLSHADKYQISRHTTLMTEYTSPPRALDDITIVDFSRVLAGPYATMLLADFGANVIKIEQPGRGDDTRSWGPPFTAAGESAYFLCANRNKRSITLNLKHPRGRAIAFDLIRQADVVVENFKVGAMAQMGLDYATVRQTNPSLIYCSITGYGQTGPDCHRPGYDAVIEAEGGIMSITGPAADDGTGEPYKVGVAIADITAGLQAVSAILAALHYRTRSSEGQYIDIALLDTQVSWLANVASAYLVSAKPPRRFGNAHPSIVPYQVMRTADGYLMLAVGNDHQFVALCHALDKPEWAQDERFITNAQRVQHRTALLALLEPAFAQRTSPDLKAVLAKAGVPCGPVNDIPTTLSMPQVTARNMVQQIGDAGEEPIPQLGPVPKMSATPPHIRTRPPRLGEHTSHVLRDTLGYTKEAIEELRRNGVI